MQCNACWEGCYLKRICFNVSLRCVCRGTSPHLIAFSIREAKLCVRYPIANNYCKRHAWYVTLSSLLHEHQNYFKPTKLKFRKQPIAPWHKLNVNLNYPILKSDYLMISYTVLFPMKHTCAKEGGVSGYVYPPLKRKIWLYTPKRAPKKILNFYPHLRSWLGAVKGPSLLQFNCWPKNNFLHTFSLI